MQIQHRITPFLSYSSQAEGAPEFYVSVVPASRTIRKVLNPANQAILTVEFELCGQVWRSQLHTWLAPQNPSALHRMCDSLWQMTKLEIATLRKAYDGGN